MSTCKVIGKLSRDPEWKAVASGLCKFSVWVDVAVWGEAGQEAMGKLHKGDVVEIEGEATSKPWQDKVFWTLVPKPGGIVVLDGEKPVVPEPEASDDLPF